MPYVNRDNKGAIVAVAQRSDEQHQEYLGPTSEELIRFVSAIDCKIQSRSALAESDRDLARVTEDLIKLLISKNLLVFTELPQAVQDKLLGREKLRTSLLVEKNSFLIDDEDL